MATFRFPLSAQNQKFSMTLNGVLYNFTVRWNPVVQSWALDILDEEDVPIIEGIVLVTGCDLLEQYGYLNFGGQLIAQTDGSDDVPNFTNLGGAANLFFVTA